MKCEWHDGNRAIREGLCCAKKGFFYSLIVGFLVVHHADANAATHEGDRPLFMAAYKGHAEVVRLLLAGGAQCDAVDSGGHDALWVAGIKGHHEIVQLLEARAAAPGGLLPDTH